MSFRDCLHQHHPGCLFAESWPFSRPAQSVFSGKSCPGICSFNKTHKLQKQSFIFPLNIFRMWLCGTCLNPVTKSLSCFFRDLSIQAFIFPSADFGFFLINFFIVLILFKLPAHSSTALLIWKRELFSPLFGGKFAICYLSFNHRSLKFLRLYC